MKRPARGALNMDVICVLIPKPRDSARGLLAKIIANLPEPQHENRRALPRGAGNNAQFTGMLAHNFPASAALCSATRANEINFEPQKQAGSGAMALTRHSTNIGEHYRKYTMVCHEAWLRYYPHKSRAA